MTSLVKAFKFAKNKPAGCTFSALISLALVSAVIAGATWLFFAFVGARILRDSISSNTGFYIVYENAFVNIFTGKCTISKLLFYNPHVYDIDLKKYQAAPTDAKIFAKMDNLTIKLSVSGLILGRLDISEINGTVDSLNCLKINHSDYNISEFFEGFGKISEITKSNQENLLKSVNLKFNRITYLDITDKNNIMKMKANTPFILEAHDIEASDKFLKNVSDTFRKNRAVFISNTIDANINK